MTQRAFITDANACTGCGLCVIACKDEHVGTNHLPWAAAQPDTGHFWMNILKVESGQSPRVAVQFMPLLCQHCENAPCIKACPEGAIQRRDDGLVWIDPATCNGCGLCVEACPYDVIYRSAASGLAQKCTGCAHLVDRGDVPRCADVCPHEAIVFTDVGALQDEDLEILHPEFEAAPRVRWRGLPAPHLSGSVLDDGGDEVVVGAAVTVTNLFDDSALHAVTDPFGDFWVRGLADGAKYRVEITKPGYRAHLAVVTAGRDGDLGSVVLQRDGGESA